MLDRVPNWGAALLAGLIFPLGLAPFEVWPIIPLSAGLLYTALNRTHRAGGTGFAYGVGFFGAGVSWVYVSIHVYGNTPVWLAVGLTTVFCGGLALLFAAQGTAFA
jgi:apolipoprotein N-acyltransferase